MKWFLGVILMLLAALVLQSSLLAYAMYVMLAVMVISRFLARNWIQHLSASRECGQLTAEAGDTVAVNVAVQNRGWLRVAWVLLEDMLPAKAVAVGEERIKVKGKRIRLGTIAARGETELSYKLHFKTRGYYQIGPLVMETGDLFGLHRRYRVGSEPHFIEVYPRVLPLEGYDLASRRPVGEIRLCHRLYEDPTRISGVREYQTGDPLNRVHWRATARTGELHCKVYEASTVAGATVLLDFHEDGYPQRGEPVRSELAVTTAVSLAHAVNVLGQQVGLISNGRDAADRIRLEGWEHDFRSREAALKSAAMRDKSERLKPLIVPTRRGVEQFQRIREILARVELTDGMTFAELIVETSGRIPRDATVLAILPGVSVEAAIALGNLRRLGCAVTAILIMMDDDLLRLSFGRLASQGILDIRHVQNQAGVSLVCGEHTGSNTPYQLEMSLTD
jgi:uncharacterized protein (DUF58 family)